MKRDRDDLRLDDFAGQWPPLLTTRRAVAFTGMSRHTIGRAAARGELPVAGRRGRTYIFRRDDLERWLLGDMDRKPIAPAAHVVRQRTPISESLARIREIARRK
jgi:excisionase family DNA binding protein